jgi:hypothetical protein
MCHVADEHRLEPRVCPTDQLRPAAIPAASTGRTLTAPDPCCSNVIKFLPWRRPHVTLAGETGGAGLAGKIIQ